MVSSLSWRQTIFKTHIFFCRNRTEESRSQSRSRTGKRERWEEYQSHLVFDWSFTCFRPRNVRRGHHLGKTSCSGVLWFWRLCFRVWVRLWGLGWVSLFLSSFVNSNWLISGETDAWQRKANKSNIASLQVIYFRFLLSAPHWIYYLPGK